MTDTAIVSPKSLLDSLWELDGPFRRIDLEIGYLWPEPRPFNLSDRVMRNRLPTCPHFTYSIDAIERLIKARLPASTGSSGRPCRYYSRTRSWISRPIARIEGS